MKPGDRAKIYKETGARVFYSTVRGCWCALWLSKGFENKVWFNRFDSAHNLIITIKKRQEEGASV